MTGTPAQASDDGRVTERHMLDALARRYSQTHGNGPRYAIAEHVKSGAGFDARRTADFIALDLWPSKGLEMHGHEVKVSRSDYLAEIRDPSKAEEFSRYMDRWWVVTSDPLIAGPADLPRRWGLMVLSGTRLVVVQPAPKLTPEPLPKTMLAALMRATAKTAVRRLQRAS